MGVGPHDAVELDRVAILVGIEPPVAVLEAREEAVLDARVERLPPHDQPGALWPVGELDQLGELDHRGSFTVLTLSLIHISEPTRRTPISYAVFCLKKKNEHQANLT